MINIMRDGRLQIAVPQHCGCAVNSKKFANHAAIFFSQAMQRRPLWHALGPQPRGQFLKMALAPVLVPTNGDLWRPLALDYKYIRSSRAGLAANVLAGLGQKCFLPALQLVFIRRFARA